MRKTSVLLLLACAAIVAAAFAAPAAATPKWTKNGSPITKVETIELEGPLSIMSGFGGFECVVHAKADLYPAAEGGGGEVYELEAAPNDCEGFGTSFVGCDLTDALLSPWWIEPAANEQEVVNENMGVGYQLEEAAGGPGCNREAWIGYGPEIASYPDDPEAISYLEGFDGQGMIYPQEISTEPFAAKLAVTPAGVYGIEAAPQAPVVSAQSASDLLPDGAELNATVDPNGEATYQFEYGLTTSYGSKVPASPKAVTGANPVGVSQAVGGLSPNTTYHYRVVVTNPNGTVKGEDRTFKTLETNTVELNGEVTVVDVSDFGTSGAVECTAHGKAKLAAGNGGQVTQLDLTGCEGSGALFSGCNVSSAQASTPLSIQASNPNDVSLGGLGAVITLSGEECLGEEIETYAADIDLTPDDAEAMSSWALSGDQAASMFGMEWESSLSGELSVTPAGYYGING